MLIPRFFSLIFVFLVLAVGTVAGAVYVPQPDTYRSMLIGPDDAQQYAHLGKSMASSGDWIALGAPWDSTGDAEAGVVKIFDATTRELVHTITNPKPKTTRWFGTTIALHGNLLAVGVPHLDEPARVYLYDLASLQPNVPTHTLVDPDPHAEGDDSWSFGDALLLSGDRLFVGASRRADSPINGRIFVYDLGGATPTTPVRRIPSPSPAEMDGFGDAMALEGNRLVVGAPAGGTGEMGYGRTYVLDLDNTAPKAPVLELTSAFPYSGAEFGSAVAISGNRVVVSAKRHNGTGRAWVYDLSTATPFLAVAELINPSAEPWAEFFGNSVAISGTRVLVGRPGNAQPGRAFLYDLTAANPGNPAHIFENPVDPTNDGFGHQVTMTETRIAIAAPRDHRGAPFAGSALLYDPANLAAAPGVLNHPGLSNSNGFGQRVAISGSRLAVSGRYGSRGGSILIHDLASATPATPVMVIENPTPDPSDRFEVVAISGSKMVVGAFADSNDGAASGCAYVFDLNGANPGTPLVTFHNPSPNPGDFFGETVAIEGNRVLVSAVGENANGQSGVVYEYDLGNSNPGVPVRVLKNPSPVDTIQFGRAVAMSGNRALISARNSVAGQSEVGVVHLFDFTSATPEVPARSIQSPVATAYAWFGQSLALEGTRALVGAPGVEGNYPWQGAAFVYDLASSAPTTPVLTLQSAQPSASAKFGMAVALSGSRIVVGEPGAYLGPTATYSGRVHVFDLGSASPSAPVATHVDPVGVPAPNFGDTLAISGATLAVGAPQKTERMPNRGAVLLFGPSPYKAWKQAVFGDYLAPDGADGDMDQLSTLAEYGLGSSPLQPNATAFTYAPFDYPDGKRLRLFLKRDPDRVDVTIQVQAADAMTGPWQTVAISQYGEPFTGPGYVTGDSATPGVKTVEIRDVVTLGQISQRFMRVNFSR